VIRVSQPLVGEAEFAAARAALERGYYGHAEKVVELEARLRDYLGAPDVVCVANGTAALHLALDGVGLGPGDEVLIPSLTFVASFQMVTAVGAVPVPCEVDDLTLRLDLADAARRATSRTRAVMPVHYAGNPCDMDAVLGFAARAGLRVVEDAAHAFGATAGGRKIGSFGDIACFSFDSIKTITCGEGGAIACADPKLAELVRQKRLLGMDRKSHAAAWKERRWEFEVRTQGYRYHMSNLNAAIGLAQLARVDEFIARRRQVARRYDEAFRGCTGLRTLPIDYDVAAPHIYVVRVGGGRRDALMAWLKARDIETGINYVPNHLHAYFGHRGAPLPVTERAYAELLVLPLHCALSDDDQETVIRAVKEFLES
jgi:perosamine synthetase